MAEIEFAALSKQCLDPRIPEVETLRREVLAWEKQRNQAKPSTGSSPNPMPERNCMGTIKMYGNLCEKPLSGLSSKFLNKGETSAIFAPL